MSHITVEEKTFKISKVCTCVSSQDRAKTVTGSLCGEPADPQLLPHHSGPLQLHAAPIECGQILLQDDPHPGLHCFPAHHERPTAYHWGDNTPHQWVILKITCIIMYYVLWCVYFFFWKKILKKFERWLLSGTLHMKSNTLSCDYVGESNMPALWPNVYLLSGSTP